MPTKLTAEHIEKIQKILDMPGRKEAVVKAEGGNIIVLLVQRKKI